MNTMNFLRRVYKAGKVLALISVLIACDQSTNFSPPREDIKLLPPSGITSRSVGDINLPNGITATIAWNAPLSFGASKDGQRFSIKGYEFEYSDREGNFENPIGTRSVSALDGTSIEVSGLPPGKFYMRLRAINTNDDKSDYAYSDFGRVRIDLKPNPNGLPDIVKKDFMTYYTAEGDYTENDLTVKFPADNLAMIGSYYDPQPTQKKVAGVLRGPRPNTWWIYNDGSGGAIRAVLIEIKREGNEIKVRGVRYSNLFGSDPKNLSETPAISLPECGLLAESDSECPYGVKGVELVQTN